MKAQSTAEYAIFFGIIIAVAVAMQKYVKRGAQAKMADVTDAMTDSGAGQELVDGVTLGARSQYEPYYLRDEQVTESERSHDQTVARDIAEEGAESRLDVMTGEADSTVTDTWGDDLFE